MYFIFPYLRRIKLQYLYWNFKIGSISWKKDQYDLNFSSKTAFVIGCGRSGTSLLGKILDSHVNTAYTYEPYYLWSVLNPSFDVLNLFFNIEASLILHKDHYSEKDSIVFQKFIKSLIKQDDKIFIEKTPLNAYRIGYINKVFPCSKFIHIVRDGIDTCKSIANLSTNNYYKIAGKPNLNQWWGNNYSRWKALKRDGKRLGYFNHEVDLLESDLSKAAYEWLVTLMEIDKWSKVLGDRLLTISFNQLLLQSRFALIEVSQFLDLSTNSNWLDTSILSIDSSKLAHSDIDLLLPSSMCKMFNSYQEKYGFDGRAKEM